MRRSRVRELGLVVLLLAITSAMAGGCRDAEPPVSVEEQGRLILEAMAAQDFSALAGFVHPDRGVRFTPYAYVDPEHDLVFTAAAVAAAPADSRVYTWGAWDGSGEPMDLTFLEYFARFVYDEDYLNAEKVGVNEFFGQGNSINNAPDVYPEATIIEYHFSGFNPDYGGMDWRSLRLVLELVDGRWVLIGVIHAEWTI